MTTRLDRFLGSLQRVKPVGDGEWIAMALKSGVTSAGKTNLVKHLRGERLTQRQAILAKYCDCMGYHVDGRLDCRMPHCSLFPFRQYKDDPSSSSKKAISSRRRGATTPPGDGTS